MLTSKNINSTTKLKESKKMLGIKRSLLLGFTWSAFGKYLTLFSQLFITAILARLLNPSDFGVIAVVMVYIGFMNLLSEAGLKSAIIQKKDLDQNGLSSIFWLSGLLGLFLFVLTIFLADPVAIFFDMPKLSKVTSFMGLTFVFISLNSVPSGLLSKRLEFSKLAFVQILSTILSGVIGIWMALNGFGYWALVFQIISSNILRFLFCLLLSKWFPSPVFLLKPVYESLKYAFHVLGFNSINYWARNADNFLIGKFIGSVGLGYYNQAYKLMRMPQNLLTGVLNSVLHPVFANLQDNLEQLRKGYYRILKLMITISLPLGIFMIILGPEIIRVIWGNKWEQSIPIFQILACVSCVQPAIATTGPILLASNRSKIYFNMGILTTFIYVSGFVVGVSFGIEGVAISYLITNAVVAPIVLYVTYSVVLSGCFFEVISLWFKPLVKSLILAIVLLSMKTYLTLSTDLARLLLSTLILLIYFIIEAINLKMLSLPMQIRKEKNNV